MVAGLVAFSRWSQERDFRPLYSALSPEDAAAILAKVRESGTEFRLSNNGTEVQVPSGKVAELRLQLAAAGVPKSGRIGFELFDKTNFGATDFAEQVNYHRALEGELERSVMSLAEVEQARVHITFPKESIFLESHQPAKASVLVKLRTGAQLSAQNVAAICQLAASAVEGLTPEAVSVRGYARKSAEQSPRGRVAGPTRTIRSDASTTARRSNTTCWPKSTPHSNRCSAPTSSAPRLRWNAILRSAEQSEETYDPTKSVMVTSQKTEDISGGVTCFGRARDRFQSAPARPRVPGPARMALPGAPRISATSPATASGTCVCPRATSNACRCRSWWIPPSGGRAPGPKTKRVVEPPSTEKLKAIHDLVAGVIGFSAERGDQLIVETLPFEATLNPEPPARRQACAAGARQPWYEQALKNKFVLVGSGSWQWRMLLTLLVVVFRLVRRSPDPARDGSPDSPRRRPRT